MNGFAVGDPTPAFTQVWTADVAHMQFDGAIGWGIEVGDYVSGLTGVPIVVLADNYGNFGTLAWIAVLNSAEQADSMNETMLGDAAWRQHLLDGDKFFTQGQTKVWLSRTL